jgi:hypothetical protein
MVMWKADGFDQCVIGTVIVPGEHGERIVYDALKCILTIQESSGDECSFEEAEEYFEFNVVGSIIKDGPAYVYLKTLEEIEEIQEELLEQELLEDQLLEEKYNPGTSQSVRNRTPKPTE